MTEQPTPIPLFTLSRQWERVRNEVRAALERVFETQQFILGPEVAALETECAAYLEVKRAIGVASGTDALLAPLMALGVGPGHEVITSPFTFFATAGVIARLGARPVFADIDPRDFNIDPERIGEAITPRTKAIIPVHLYGQAADMDAIRAVAGPIPIIEDCCQAIGTPYGGKPVGGLGTVGSFSFFPTKNLGACGDGGLVTTNDESMAELLVDIRVHGMRPKYVHHTVGGNFRIDAMQAAILRAKLPHLDGWIAARRLGAAHYRELFSAAGLDDIVGVPPELPGRGHSYHQYVVRVADRDRLRQYLQEHGIGSEVYYPICLHEQECFSALGYRRGDLPVAERAASEVLALPIFPELRADERERVVETIAGFYRGSAGG
jgi:dTDP-4-amino-4,6-dideoxygalactose transaminase